MSTEITEVKIALADDHVLLRNALAQVIDNFDGFKVILQASTGDELLEKMQAGAIPDIVLLDLDMPGLGGRETARRLSQDFPGVYVMMLTMYDTETTMMHLLRVGVRGFPRKDISPMDLKFALNAVLHTGYYHSNDTTGKIVNIFRRDHPSDSLVRNMLSEKEIALLKHSCTTLTYKEIAHKMGVHQRTIDSLRDNLFDKLEIRSRIGLAMYAMKHGIFAF